MAEKTITVELTEDELHYVTNFGLRAVNVHIASARRKIEAAAALAAPTQPDHPGMAKGLERQAAIIAAIRSHLTDAENEHLTDRVIWQRAVKFGPKTSQGHAESLRSALANAGDYGGDLAAALDVEPEQPAVPEHVEEGDWPESIQVFKSDAYGFVAVVDARQESHPTHGEARCYVPAPTKEGQG